MSAAGDPAACPSGHTDSVRLLSMFTRAGSAVPDGGGGGSGGCH